MERRLLHRRSDDEHAHLHQRARPRLPRQHELPSARVRVLRGRLLVSVLFIPAYYQGDLETAYDFLAAASACRCARPPRPSLIVTRVLASGVRLFATAIPVHMITGLSYPVSILLIGGFTLAYTYLGGLKAVVAMDVVQMLISSARRAASMVLIVHHLPGGWADVLDWATRDGANKLEILNLKTGGSLIGFLSAPYTAARWPARRDLPHHGLARHRPAARAAAARLPLEVGRAARADARRHAHRAAVRVLPGPRAVPLRLLRRPAAGRARPAKL